VTNRIADPETLSDTEAESVAQAIDIFRAAPTSPSFFHTEPLRDDTGKLCEVRFYKDSDSQQPLAVIAVTDDGAVPPIDAESEE
jgi:hypothetical protein